MHRREKLIRFHPSSIGITVARLWSVCVFIVNNLSNRSAKSSIVCVYNKQRTFKKNPVNVYNKQPPGANVYNKQETTENYISLKKLKFLLNKFKGP